MFPLGLSVYVSHSLECSVFYGVPMFEELLPSCYVAPGYTRE